MEIEIPHEIIYETPATVPVADVIDSLIGTDRAARELKDILEGCIDGLSVRSIRVGIRTINQDSPLRELFVLSLIIGFQDDLKTEVPEMIEKILGVPVPDKYDSVVTVSLLIILFYGADFLYRKYHSALKSNHIKGQLDGLIADLSKKTHCPEEKIREVLERKYGGRRLRTLARAAIQVFRPSKHQANAEIRLAGRKIDTETVAEMPGDVAEETIEPGDTSEFLSDVEIEIHAQDMDRARQGWAAIIPGHVDKRLRMQIFPPVKPEDIWTRARVRGDVIIVYEKQENDELKPTMIHLLRISE